MTARLAFLLSLMLAVLAVAYAAPASAGTPVTLNTDLTDTTGHVTLGELFDNAGPARDVVVADRLAPPELLAELPPHVEVIDAAKIPYGRAMAQDAINDVMIERARAGRFR